MCLGYRKPSITNYDFKINTYSDIDFGREVINQLIEDKNENPNDEISEIDTDGAYFDQDLVDKALDNKIEIYFTNLVEKKTNPDKLSPTEFKIDEKQNMIVECPNGVSPIRSDFSKMVYSAHFNKEKCEKCPLYNQCLIKEQKKDNVVRFSDETYKTEQVRKEMSTDEYKAKASKRAGVEGVPSALRRGYNVDRMPIRDFCAQNYTLVLKSLPKCEKT